ncbi:hypothetical protein LWI29_032105 [Acer saccharum]|uniref:Protein kinase domain-containing protein n=1 Tax=Acer saccharum TaxID=4024 RepID=A0AA39T7P0_ACESA|nr:hypothetical protein LWI29_032105 [Acer saccharum]
MATKTKIFFVMEYAKRGELFAKIIAKGRLNEDLARRYFQQLISAVDFCHSRGICHRDLKPENILLDENEDLKISDFGQAFCFAGAGVEGCLAAHTMRDSSLCCAGGYLPFQHENVMKMYRKIFKAEFVFPPWISMGAKKLISRVLIAEDDKRITFSGIMKNPWFRKGFDREFSRVISGEDGEKSGGRRKGKLAEVYEVALEVTVVELSKSAGDSVKYRKLCEEDVRPGLEDIVWSWQGESIN